MKTSIPTDEHEAIMEQLGLANAAFYQRYPGDRPDRQPVHTVYGGANLFRRNAIPKLGQVAVKNFQSNAPNFAALAKAFGWEGYENMPTGEALEALLPELAESERPSESHGATGLAYQIYQRVLQKLETEAIEDFRIDFEDGFGNRSNEEEDETALQASEELAHGMRDNTLSPFIGIRIKPFTEDLKLRGVRTLDLFLTNLVKHSEGKLPENFVVMLPKVTIPQQVEALVKLLDALERQLGLAEGLLKMEMMVEQTQAVIDAEGTNPLLRFIDASEGRMKAVAFGTYDYTASCNITAKYQTMGHPACDFAHHMTRVAIGHTGIWISDGATNVMPIGPHRGKDLSPAQIQENREVVQRAWKQSYDHIRHSLYMGLYQGWDLNPAQLPARYSAVYSFFLESYSDAAERLHKFIDKAAQATLTGDIFDDAATGQGLLNYFLAALNCGAISEADTESTGLSLDEIRTRSFYRILQGRREKASS